MGKNKNYEVNQEKNTVRTTKTGGYVMTNNGKQYYVCGKLYIEITEHFAKNGKPLGSLIENVITYTAGKQAS